MLLSKDAILQAKNKLSKHLSWIVEKSRLSQVTASPTRLKIILLLKEHKELCPTDIANILDITISAVSHQVRVLEHAGLVKKIRMGKMICYSIEKKKMEQL